VTISLKKGNGVGRPFLEERKKARDSGGKMEASTARKNVSADFQEGKKSLQRALSSVLSDAKKKNGRRKG